MSHNGRAFENFSCDGQGEQIVNNFIGGEHGVWGPPSVGGNQEQFQVQGQAQDNTMNGGFQPGTAPDLSQYAGQFMPPSAYGYADAGAYASGGYANGYADAGAYASGGYANGYAGGYGYPDAGGYSGSIDQMPQAYAIPDAGNYPGAPYMPGPGGAPAGYTGFDQSGAACNGNGAGPAGGDLATTVTDALNQLTSPGGQKEQALLFNYATDNIGTLAKDAQKIPDGTIDLTQPIQSFEAATGITPQGQAGKLLSDLASASKSGTDQYQINLNSAESFGPIHLSKSVKFQEHDVNGALQLDHIQGATVHVAGTDVAIDSLKLTKGSDGKPQFTAQGSHFTVSGEINSAALSKNGAGQIGAAIDVKNVDVNAFGHNVQIPNWVRSIF